MTTRVDSVQGALPRIMSNVTDLDDVPRDAASHTVTITAPPGATAPSLTPTSTGTTGETYVDLPLTASGWWHVAWLTTNPTTAQHLDIYAAPI